MTEAFEKWVEEQAKTQHTDDWDCVHPLSRRAAHFWLTRIFAEIELEATEWYDEHRLDTWEVSLAIVVSRIKVRFGLGGAE